ncbi:translation initiation factor [Haloarchaeobius sp. TZWWS8]|uniref:translation initiation factor n=1 Tax=Haloarchaeobius sp. TZWWS8 TaxID=3446121 RepID=UPI003EBD54F5
MVPENHPSQFDDLDLIGDLDRAETELSVRVERRRYGKPMTVIDGFPEGTDLRALASKLKRAVGAGGTVDDETIEIQGDQTERVVALLRSEGYAI